MSERDIEAGGVAAGETGTCTSEETGALIAKPPGSIERILRCILNKVVGDHQVWEV